LQYKKLALTSIGALAIVIYVLPITDWYSQVTAQSNEAEETEDQTGTEELEEEEEELEAQGDDDKLKDGDPDANNGNGNDAKDDDDEDEDDEGNPNNREGTPGTERCLERSNGNCANSPVHDGDYGKTSSNDADDD
jgi:hypothetical protein